MKHLIILVAAAMLVAACSTISTQKENKMQLTNKGKVAALLESIETGNPEPVGFINPQKYIQHNQAVADGLAGFGEVLNQLPEGSAKVDTVRIFEDGEYVFSHTDYNFFGPKVGFDIFRFENGLIVEHWDNLQEKVAATASGRSQTDGPVEIADLDKTQENKALIRNMIDDVFLGSNADRITDYISSEKYYQHNPAVKDGLSGLGEALQALAKAGTPMIYEKNHIILGQGNFVLAVSEGIFLNEKVSFYDLFRIENGKVVEHWDVIEKILPDEQARNQNGKFNF